MTGGPRGRRRPTPAEYDSFYHGYISLVPEGDIIDTLREQREVLQELIAAIPEDKSDYRYAPGKWTTRISPGASGSFPVDASPNCSSIIAETASDCASCRLRSIVFTLCRARA